MNKDSWEVKMIGEVFDLYMGRTPSRSNPMYWGDNTGYKWVSISDIGNEKYIQTTKEFISELGKKESKIKVVPKGTVIMSFKLSIGKVAITAEDMYTNEAIMAFYPINSSIFEQNYIYYYLKGYDWIGSNRAVMGTTLNKFSISNSKIVIPPIAIQEQIVKELDTLSDIITKKKEQLAELDKLAQATFYDMFGDPVENEKNWKTTLIQNICTINPTKSSVKSLNSNLPVSFIPMAAVGEQGEFYANEIKLLHEVYKGFTYFEEGDILFAKITPCMENGKGAIARGLKNNIGFGSTEFHVLRPNSECNNSFLYFITKLDLFRKAAEKEMTGSAGQKRVPKSFLQKWTLILPPISLQNQFAKKIEAIEQQKALINQSITDTQLLFDYTMDKYFN